MARLICSAQTNPNLCCSKIAAGSAASTCSPGRPRSKWRRPMVSPCAKDGYAAVLAGCRRGDMSTGKVNLLAAEHVGSPASQRPTIVGMHCWRDLAAVPGLGAFQHVTRVGVDVEGARTIRQEPG